MAPPFQPFDSRQEFHATYRNLPHWQQPGATYFVTFRLADSLPADVRARFQEMQRLNDAESFAWVERYLDAGTGECLLRHPAHAALIAAALRHFDGTHYALGAFVVMPNHVHALAQPLLPATLTSTLHSWKSYTANALQRHGAISGQVWQEESFDRIVRDESELKKFSDYILANPAVARLSPGTFLVGQGTADWLDSPP